jgi:hypothetical protein
MYRAFPSKFAGRIDRKRLAWAEIIAGVVYLIAFNTFLPDADMERLGFVLLVAFVCAPFVLRRRAETDSGRPERATINRDGPVICEPKLIGAAMDTDLQRKAARGRARCRS